MERSGHIGCWILLASIIGYLTSLNLPVFLLLTSIGVFFAHLPDKDIKYGRHRGGMHSLLFVVVIATVAGGIAWIAWMLIPQKIAEPLAVITTLNSGLHVFVLVGGAVFCGLLSHILADVITLSGIPLFWPKKKRYALRLCRSDSTAVNGIFFLSGFVTLLLVLWTVIPKGML